MDDSSGLLLVHRDDVLRGDLGIHNDTGIAELPTTLRREVGIQVALATLRILDFARTRDAHAFLNALVCLVVLGHEGASNIAESQGEA